MTQPDLRKLAQQGDPGAIARLLNRTLQPRGVTARVVLNEQELKILIASSRPLEQQAFVQLIQQQINALNSPAITRVKIYSQQVGEATPSWYQEFVPTSPPKLFGLSSNRNGKTAGSIVPTKPNSPGAWATLKSFQLDSIIPYKEIFNPTLYRSGTVRLLLFLGLLPLIVNLLAEQISLDLTAWLIGIYYASIWGVVLYDLIKPPYFSWGNTLRCILFTSFIGIPLLLFFQRVPPFDVLYQAVNGGLLSRLVGFIFGVGVLEEACKALPVYLLLNRPGKPTDPHTSAYYGAMSGLGFAIAEGAVYSIRYALDLTQGTLGLGSYVAASTIRFISLPLFHAILAGIVGYFIGLATINPSRRVALVLIGLAIAAILHGFYNTFAGGIPGLFIIAFTILLFITYLRRSKQMVEEMQQAEQGKQRNLDS